MFGLEENLWLTTQKERDDSGIRNQNQNLSVETRIGRAPNHVTNQPKLKE